MTDILTLGLGLDTSQFARGAKTATDALDPVQSKLTQVTTSSSRFEGSLKEVTKAASGTAQVTQGVGNLAKALGEGAIGAAAFIAVGLSIEVAKTADDFRDLTSAVTTTGETMRKVVIEYDALGIATQRVVQVQTVAASSVFSRLWLVLKSNPLIAVTAAISALGVAMSLFSSKTVEATDKFKDFLEETGKLRKREVTAENFPEQVRLQIARQKNSRLFDIATEIGTQGKPITIKKLSEITGYSEADLSGVIDQKEKFRYDPRSNRPIIDPADIALEEQITRMNRGKSDVIGRLVLPRQPSISPPGDYIISAEAATETLGRFYGQTDKNLSEREEKLRTKPDDVKAATKEAAQAAKDADVAMEEVLNKAEQFGQSMGDAWYQFISGAQTGEQLVRQIIASFLRGQSQEAGQSLFRGLQSAVSGVTSRTAPSAPADPDPGFGTGGGGGGFGFGYGSSK